MGRFAFGQKQLYLTREFSDGAFAAVLEENVAKPPVVFSFAGMTPNGVSRLMKNCKLWCPSSCKRAVKEYRTLSRTLQRNVLNQAHIYKYPRVEAHPDIPAATSSDEEEADHGSGSENGSANSESSNEEIDLGFDNLPLPLDAPPTSKTSEDCNGTYRPADHMFNPGDPEAVPA